MVTAAPSAVSLAFTRLPFIYSPDYVPPAISPTFAPVPAPISLATLAAIILAFLIAPAATAYEAFKVANPNLGALPNKPVVTGTNWVACFQGTPTSDSIDKSQIVVMDTDTGFVTHTIPCPPNLSTFGTQMVTDGNYLATLSYKSPSDLSGSIVHVWKMPGAAYVGSRNVTATLEDPSIFIGLGNGRLVSARSDSQIIRQWNAADLSPLPDITLPVNGPSWVSPYHSFTMGGDDLVLAALHTADVYHLLHVKLSTGVITDLPVPPDFGNRSLAPSAVANGRLIAVASPAVHLDPTSMYHYDLATGQIVAETPLSAGGFYTRAFLAPDASSWAAVSLDYTYGKPSELRTGSVPETPGTSVFLLAPDTIVTGHSQLKAVAFSYSQNHLWFRPESYASTDGYRSCADAEGIVAYRIPLFSRPVTTLSVRALPCQESDGRLQFLLSLSQPAPIRMTANFRTAADLGTATAGVDYQPVDTTVTFLPNQTEALLEIPLIQDNLIEENETLVLQLTGRSGEIHVGETQFPGFIGGSSFHRLPPAGAWTDAEPLRVLPHAIAIAGDHLVQSNTYASSPANAGTAPRVLTRPIIGGAWTPSTALASISPVGNGLYTNDSGLAALTSNEAIRFYEPATDTLRFQATPGSSFTILGDTHALTLGSPLKEYSLNAPYESRPPVEGSYLTGINLAAYAQDVLIASLRDLPDGGLHMISRTTRADLGQFIPGWKDLPSYIAASGNLFAATKGTRAWFRYIDQPGQLLPLRPAFGPLSDISDIRIAGNRILVTQTPADLPPSIRIFEVPSGIEIGTLLADPNESPAETDFSAYLPEGFTIPPNLYYPPAGYSLKNFTSSGKHIVAAITWPQITRSRNLVAASFLQETGLPGIIDPAPIMEGRDELTFTLTEAAPFPLVISAVAIPSLENKSSDWVWLSNAYVPAGATTFTAGLGRVNDELSRGTIAAPIELMISGNGINRTIRTSVQILDDDRLSLDAITHTFGNLGPDFTPVSGGWAHRPLREDQQNVIGWTGDPTFTHGTSFGTSGNAGFASAFVGTGDWLAVTQDAFAISAKKINPSRIQIYLPATTGSTPVRILKGRKDVNNFGKTLYARDSTLWVGAPGSNGTGPKPKLTSGQVFQYNLATGKKTHTFKPPKGPHAVGFGTSIAANDTSVWIGSPVTNGAFFHFSRAKGKLLNSVISPDVVESRTLGRILAATNSGLLFTSSDFSHDGTIIHAYLESNGKPLWTLKPPAGRRFETFTLVSDDLLAAAGNSLTFYRLDGPTPELLVEVLIPGGSALIRKLEFSAGRLALHRDQSSSTPDDTIFLTLSDIAKLAPFLPTASASLADPTGITPPQPPVLALSQSTPDHWQLQLPSPAQAAETNTTLQVSTDLITWTPLAAPTPGGTAWQLLPGTPLEASPALIINGITLQVPPKLPQLFFRLHIP